MSDEELQQFMALTNCSAREATDYIQDSNGNLETALNAYFSKKHELSEPAIDNTPNSTGSNPPNLMGSQNRSSSSTSAPNAPSSSKSTRKEPTKFKSLTQMLKETQANEDDEDDEARHTFAGGETSGLEVTDPNDSNSLIKNLLEKARREGERGTGSEEERDPSGKQNFSGKGYRLGTSVDPSEPIVDAPAAPEKAKKVTREITFWKEGFQVGEDGPLYRYDDPSNSYYLNELNQGRAPLKLLNVEFGQEVDVNVFKKLDESFKPPKRKLGGFEGSGRRLGSPIPGENISTVAQEDKDKSASPKAETSSVSKDTQSQGDTSVQIRYADGRREILRCNKTDTVQFLYDHVKNNTPISRTFSLNQAMPIKLIDQYDSTIEEQNLCSSVVVQRWT
ncbi:HHL123Wp [Eremothecium sinecaudum]|uniref:HHL123Wp n=1 Tax=Eremothecium sinecaudum TaxID=45286 RepID=A0A0X8HWA4_9SACH|nr:HHL123Wp [Eremothecium sinecaudum]AMD22647.1 HHL123Wp [Eremothecium sinecaudum]